MVTDRFFQDMASMELYTPWLSLVSIPDVPTTNKTDGLQYKLLVTLMKYNFLFKKNLPKIILKKYDNSNV